MGEEGSRRVARDHDANIEAKKLLGYFRRTIDRQTAEQT
jgi:hypothetical protein